MDGRYTGTAGRVYISWCGLVLVCFCTFGTVSSAQTVLGPVVVADLSSTAPTAGRLVVVDASTFNDAVAFAEETRVRETGLATPLERIVGGCRGDQTLEELGDLLIDVQRCMDCLVAYEEKRFVTNRGDPVIGIVLHDRNDTISISPRELRRRSELFESAASLTNRFLRRTVVDKSMLDRELVCTTTVHFLRYRRSHFSFAFTVRHSRSQSEPVVSPEIVLGPKEQWFLSADFSIPKEEIGSWFRSEGGTTETVARTPQPDEDRLQNRDFLVGINFAVDDLLADRESSLYPNRIWRNFVVKLQFAPSWRPLESFGLGIALRGYRIRTILWNMDDVHPYFVVGRKGGPNGGWRAVFGLGWDPRSLAREE